MDWRGLGMWISMHIYQFFQSKSAVRSWFNLIVYRGIEGVLIILG